MRSPFLVIPDFLSPSKCEEIIASSRVAAPDLDANGDPIKSEHHIFKWDREIVDHFRDLIPEIEDRYDCTYRGTEKPLLQYFPENAKTPAQNPGCENAKYVRKKWVKHRDIDLVGFIWLKDYNQDVPLDPRYEVFGGKLEFPAYNFSLVPQRGTLVLFPAGPHFITVISPVMVGDLYQIKLCVGIQPKEGGLWLYQPQKYPGKWQDWFAEHF